MARNLRVHLMIHFVMKLAYALFRWKNEAADGALQTDKITYMYFVLYISCEILIFFPLL